MSKQTSLGLDTSARNPAVHSYKTDFTVMFIGRMAGEGCRVIKCPVCSRNCIGQEYLKKWRFVHGANIQSTGSSTTWEPTDCCTMSYDAMQTLRDLGVVRCNRLGQILEVR
jgi:hypothetical protein